MDFRITMKKIKTLFARNQDDHLVYDEITAGAAWVALGKGIATRKFDGTCCLFKDGKLFKRYDAKHGKTTPEGFVPAQEPDLITGHWPGWLETTDNPSDRYFREAFKLRRAFISPVGTSIENYERPFVDGQTYELIGPKINSNPDGAERHILIVHGGITFPEFPRTFQKIKEELEHMNIEGVVWHHPEGLMVKIKKSDFGFKR